MRLLRIALAVAGPALGWAACSDDGTTASARDTTLEAVIPSAEATGVDPAGPITARFSAPMGTGMERYVDLHQGDIGGPIVQASCAWSADRTTLTCTPGVLLQSGTGYTIHMGLGMMDASGRPVETEERGRREIQEGDDLVIVTNCPGSLEWRFDAGVRQQSPLFRLTGALGGLGRHRLNLAPIPPGTRAIEFRFQCAHEGCKPASPCQDPSWRSASVRPQHGPAGASRAATMFMQ